MCYSPKISIAAAIIELFISGCLWLRFKHTIVIRFLAIFVTLLGFYQFTEFMLCVTPYASFWARMGVVTYSILPALALHFVLLHKKVIWKKTAFLLYVPALIFIFIALFKRDFVVESACSAVFVVVKTLFFGPSGDLMPMLVYWIYYFGYIFATLAVLLKYMFVEKSNRRRLLYLLAAIGVLITLAPPLILIIILPSFGIMFPSIYCAFAFLFSVAALIGAYIEERRTSFFG